MHFILSRHSSCDVCGEYARLTYIINALLVAALTPIPMIHGMPCTYCGMACIRIPLTIVHTLFACFAHHVAEEYTGKAVEATQVFHLPDSFVRSVGPLYPYSGLDFTLRKILGWRAAPISASIPMPDISEFCKFCMPSIRAPEYPGSSVSLPYPDPMGL